MNISIEDLTEYLEFHFEHQYASVESLPDGDDRIETVIETAFNNTEYASSNFVVWFSQNRSDRYYERLIEPNTLFAMLREIGKWFDDNFGIPLDYCKLTPEWTINSYVYMMASQDSSFVADYIDVFIADNTPTCKMCSDDCRKNDLCGHGVADGVCCICDECHCEAEEEEESDDDEEEKKELTIDVLLCCVCYENKRKNYMDALVCCESGFTCHECVCEYISSNAGSFEGGGDGYDDFVFINCPVCKKRHRVDI
jgi:hypothetical protein